MFYLSSDSSRIFDHLDEAVEVAEATNDVVIENNVVVWRPDFDGMRIVMPLRTPCVSSYTDQLSIEISEYFKLLHSDVDPKEPLL